MDEACNARYLDGLALKRLRLAAGMEQAELAAKVGSTQAQVSNWERCNYGCRIGMLHKLAEALGCPPADLMRKNGDGKGENGAAA